MNEKINAIIIDDEENFTAALEILLRKHFPKINIVGNAISVASGVAMITTYKPKLVFLDINLPDGLGFDILSKTSELSYEIIFTTAYNEFALRAFEVSALHYLMKPITVEKLRDAIERYEKAHEKDYFDEKLKILKESLVDKPQRILLPTSDGMSVFNIADIVRCEADSNYSFVHFNTKHKVHLSKPLQYLDKILNELDFVRIHHKHLVNLRYMKKYKSGRKPYILLSDNTELPISETYSTAFAEHLKHFAKSY